MKRIIWLIVILLSVPAVVSIVWAGIANTKHNLSVTGPGTIKAVSETEICVFCHTPHGASAERPLWNHTMSSQTYILPTSSDPQWSNLLTTVQQPDGDTRLCLSCHDGTVAIGSVVNLPGPAGGPGTIAMQGVGGSGEMPSTAYGFIGTDLSGTHPVSIAVNDTLINDKNACTQTGAYTLQYPPGGSPVRLRPTNNTYNGEPGNPVTTATGFTYNAGVQCTSCHDPHIETTDFLVLGTGSPDPTKGHPGSWSALCDECHPGTCP
jgi:hypothetical protein